LLHGFKLVNPGCTAPADLRKKNDKKINVFYWCFTGSYQYKAA